MTKQSRECKGVKVRLCRGSNPSTLLLVDELFHLGSLHPLRRAVSDPPWLTQEFSFLVRICVPPHLHPPNAHHTIHRRRVPRPARIAITPMIPHPGPALGGHILHQLLLQHAIDEEARGARQPVDAVFVEGGVGVDADDGGAGRTVVGVVEGGGVGGGVGIGGGVSDVFYVGFAGVGAVEEGAWFWGRVVRGRDGREEWRRSGGERNGDIKEGVSL